MLHVLKSEVSFGDRGEGGRGGGLGLLFLNFLDPPLIVIDSFNEIGLFLGIFEESEDFLLINHFMLLGKYYIYISLPSLRGFIVNI